MSGSREIQSAKLFISLAAIAVSIILIGPPLLGKGKLNLGFIYLNRASSSKAEAQKYEAIWRSERFFADASGFPQSEGSAKRGLGFALWQKGQKADAVEVWREAQLPEGSLVTFGEYANAIGNGDEALSWYEASASLDLATTATPLAQQLHERSDYESAIDVWQRALATYPNSQERLIWWLGLSSSLRGNQEWQRAEDVTREALNEFPKNPQLLTALASVLLGLELDYESISTILLQAISLDEDAAEAYIVMARLMSRENRSQEAFDYFSLAIERDPSAKWLYVARANMARQLGNIELARTFLLETIDLFPDYAPAHYELAWIFKLVDDPVQAQKTIDQALDLHNAPPLNYYILAGDIYAWSDRVDLARSAYLRAAELAPEDERVIQGLESVERTP